jgi:hypothetical protein
VIVLEWDRVGRIEWQALLGRARSGLQQGWSYGEALRATGIPVRRAVARSADGSPVACLQVADRNLLGHIGLSFLLRGPVWLAPELRASIEPALLRELRRRLGRRPLIWAPETPSALARRPIIIGHSTAWLDLSLPLAELRRGLAPDWRAGLRQGEAAPLTVPELAGAPQLQWLLDRNAAHRRAVGYRGPSQEFLARLARAAADAGELQVLVALERSEPVAGVMLVRHGLAATYGVGHVTGRGRALRATHRLLWHGIERLAQAGVRWLDLGGIATDRSPGLAHFKLGLGGAVVTLPGTFLWLGCGRRRPQDGPGS